MNTRLQKLNLCTGCAACWPDRVYYKSSYNQYDGECGECGCNERIVASVYVPATGDDVNYEWEQRQ